MRICVSSGQSCHLAQTPRLLRICRLLHPILPQMRLSHNHSRLQVRIIHHKKSRASWKRQASQQTSTHARPPFCMSQTLRLRLRPPLSAGEASSMSLRQIVSCAGSKRRATSQKVLVRRQCSRKPSQLLAKCLTQATSKLTKKQDGLSPPQLQLSVPRTRTTAQIQLQRAKSPQNPVFQHKSTCRKVRRAASRQLLVALATLLARLSSIRS
mmetsp:Transcript_38384/g.66248  ORF Transcript_38384/g.66248 Transcript_38384/m.66248 type:complete len:211 (+) Transcript_38384:1965-2597(+)